jgi:hypothetical protein
MIRPIRKCHKIFWIVLVVLLPILFIAGIAFRHTEPVNENIPKTANSEQSAVNRFEN